MKKWLCGTLCTAVIATTMMSIMPLTSAESVDNSIKVVSLGDSIARGYGCQPEEAYGYLLAQQIKSDVAGKGYSVDFVNYGHDGDTSTDLLDKLSDTDISASVKDADIITISIGGNNLMRGLYVEMAKAFNIDINSANFENNLMKAFQTTDAVTLVSKLTPIFTMDNPVKAGTDTPCQRMKAIEEAYEKDITAILANISKVNSTARVILTTIPNPTKDAILGTAMDPYFQQYNNYIRTQCPVANKVYVADSDKAFKEYTGTQALTFTNIDWTDMSKTVLDPHPTPFGHEQMEKVHYAQIKEYIAGIPAVTTNTTSTTAVTTTVTTTTAATTTATVTTPSTTVVTSTESTAASTTETEAAQANTSPKTGDNTTTAVFTMLSLALVSGGIVLSRKIKK